MQRTITIETFEHTALCHITDQIQEIVAEARVETGIVHIYARATTAAIVIQEDWQNTVPLDITEFLNRLVPQGQWRHDEHDGNGDAHIKAALVGSSETVPISNGKMNLGPYQNIFLCELDGPRNGARSRDIIVTVISDK